MLIDGCSDENFEEKLLASDFSEKDIRKLKSILQQDKYQKETLQLLVNVLRKRFLGGLVALVILLIIGSGGIISSDTSNAVPYIIVMTFAFIVIYCVTPLRLAWKSYKFVRKRKC